MDKQSPHILIAVPSPDWVHVDFAQSLMQAMQYMQGKVAFTLCNMKGSRISVNRNELVELAFKNKSSHILFIDADMTFPPDAPLVLLNHNKPIVCATATSRRPAKTHGVIGTREDGLKEYPTNGLVKMQRVGAPFMLIQMQVFGNLKKPYFAEPVLDDYHHPLGEDYYFCEEVRKKNYTIWCDMTLSMQIGHVGLQTYYIGTLEQQEEAAPIIVSDMTGES